MNFHSLHPSLGYTFWREILKILFELSVQRMKYAWPYCSIQVQYLYKPSKPDKEFGRHAQRFIGSCIGCIDPHILDLDTNWRWVVSFTLRPLTPGKESAVPIGHEAGWTPEPIWMTWRTNNSWPYQDSNPVPSVVQTVASRYTDCAIPARI
jgi:hypothetical protein